MRNMNTYKVFKEIFNMTKERVMDILARYVDNDLCSADPDYVREVLLSICTMEEIKELGLGYLWDDLN